MLIYFLITAADPLNVESLQEVQESQYSHLEYQLFRNPWSTPTLVIEDFMYNCHIKNNRKDRVYWRCHNYSKKPPQVRCRARCVIANGKISIMTGFHNHPPHTEKIKKLSNRPYITPSGSTTANDKIFFVVQPNK